MTLLHQAAQKAVEAARVAFEQDAEGHYAGIRLNATRTEDGYINPAWDGDWRIWLRAWQSALQQQPEPADSLLASHLAYTRAHLPALQQQEVPREPVALNDGVPDAEAAMAYALKRWGYKQGTSACVAFYRGACWCVLAAAPSTPENAGGGKEADRG